MKCRDEGSPGSGKCRDAGSPWISESQGCGEPRSGAQPPLGSAATCRRQPGPGGATAPLCSPLPPKPPKPTLSLFPKGNICPAGTKDLLEKQLPGAAKQKASSCLASSQKYSPGTRCDVVSKVSSAQRWLIRPGSGRGIPQIRSQPAEPSIAGARASSSASAGVCGETRNPPVR